MITEKLYQKDVYRKECTSTIIEVKGTGTDADPFILVLDKTIFFPVGGGQPCDVGKINNFAVIDVYEDDGVVCHKISNVVQNPADLPGKLPFEEGQRVHAELDWESRFRNMQRHCGEHILSGMFFQECGGVNRGFHMGENCMTIGKDVKEISWEQASKVELLANQAVWSNVPVSIRYFKDREEAEKLPLRKALAIDEDIIIVCVGDEENPADCVACCGTHPSTSGQVGIIKIIKLENYKGMTRVYFKAGAEAYLDYRIKNDIINQLSNKYSADEKDLLDKIHIQNEKIKAIRQELHDIKKSVIERYAEELQLILKAAGDSTKVDKGSIKPKDSMGSIPVVVRKYNELKIDDLQNLGRQLTITLSAIRGLLVLVSPKEYTAMLFSNGTPDCGKLVRDNASIYNGKGGGNATNARAIFTKDEYIDTFIDLLVKHLK